MLERYASSVAEGGITPAAAAEEMLARMDE
jgi:hypothetical protein